MAVLINASTSSGLQLTPDTSGAIAFQNNGSTAATIDSSGNVGIGTTNPLRKLDISGGGLAFTESGGASRSINWGNTDGVYPVIISGISTSGNCALIFATNTFGNTATERMRIDSSGNVGIGTTNPGFKLDVGYGSGTQVKISGGGGGDVNQGAQIQLVNTSGGSTISSKFIRVNNGGTLEILSNSYAGLFGFRDTGELSVGGLSDQGPYNLQCNGTGVWGAGAYVNGSDERIKENIEPISSCLSIVENLKPVTFKYKQDWSKDQSVQTGFIAQDLQQALVGQVYLEGIVQQGPEYLNVAYQSLIPILTKALQEANAKIDALTERVEALEARP